MEIGSEFHYCEIEKGKGIPFSFKDNKVVYTFSGRTAIETILKNEKKIRKALLPSYCCDSMIEPFRKANIYVEFYPVYYSDGFQIELEIDSNVDCVLWCNYFGFSNNIPIIKDFINRGGLLIEDITHSLYSKKQFDSQSHYCVASLRKWEPIFCGGLCVSRKDDLLILPTKKPDNYFIEIKSTAMQLKKRYIKGEAIDKNEYLELFSNSNKWIEKNYSDIGIDEFSKKYLENVEFEVHRIQRIKNANVLYDGLMNHNEFSFLFSREEIDCPLFVPIYVKNGKRDLIRKKLIEEKIYCPVHWPHPKENCSSNLYDSELSLVCDHRYTEKDMLRIVNILNQI